VDLRCALTSNGTLVPDRSDVVRQLQALTISLDGDAAAHDFNRGRGNHAEALRAIAAARAWGVPVTVNAAPNAGNAGGLDWLLEFSRRERIPITLNIMRSEDNRLWKHAARRRLDDSRLRELIGKIVEAR
jgi:MoaA/NifB/PqqE/SkfB family radical SAM enzyme